MRRLETVGAAERGRNTDRAALVAAERQVDLARADQRRAPRRGSAGAVLGRVRVSHRTRGTGVTAGREAVRLAHRLADDGSARVQDPGHDAGVDGRDVALEDARAVHHGHAGEHHVVLEYDFAPVEHAGVRTLDARLHVPRTERVLLGGGAAPGSARVPSLWRRVGSIVQRREHRKDPAHHVAIGLDVVGTDVEPQALRDGGKACDITEQHRERHACADRIRRRRSPRSRSGSPGRPVT